MGLQFVKYWHLVAPFSFGGSSAAIRQITPRQRGYGDYCMESFAEIGQRTPSIAIATAKATENLSTAIATEGNKITSTVADETIKKVRDLLDPEWEPYYYKRLYSMGVDKFLRAAVIARTRGNNPRKLFSFLIKS